MPCIKPLIEQSTCTPAHAKACLFVVGKLPDYSTGFFGMVLLDWKPALCLPKNMRDFPVLAANEDGGSSSRRDAIQFAGNNEAFQGGLQRDEMNIWNRQTECELFPRLIWLEHDILKTSPPCLFLNPIPLRATTDKEEHNVRSTF